VSSDALLLGGGLAVAAAAALVSLRNWRWPVYGLLLYLPVSGLPILALYPETAPGVLAKDFLFVIPAYVAFLAWALRRRVRIDFPGAPTALLVMLGLLVALQALNPALPNLLVGAIGVKVWLLYIPLYFLAYHLVRDRDELFRVLGLVSLAALVPALVGIAEAVLFRSGQAEFVYGLYGDAAAAATQNFTALQLEGGGVLRRVPGTFSSWTQYYAFAVTMVAVTYAWWRGSLAGTRYGLAGLGVWLTMVSAALLSGARVAFVAVPAVIALAFLLERGFRPGGLSGLVRRLVVPVAALAAAVTLLGLGVSELVRETAWKARLEFTETFLGRFGQATELTLGGFGTGIDTIASRYAYSRQELFPAVEGTWYESWFVKVVLELGIPGLVLVLSVFAVILFRGFDAHRRLRDPRLRAVSAAILAFLVLNVLAAVTKPYIDLDPVNVLFWFLAGLLARLPSLDTSREAPAR